ncbi:MAG TPA: O-antigen ligase family protein [Terriglobales bacterium]|nr:O-antigen ligase family protein [Terriglobales bacterium]
MPQRAATIIFIVGILGLFWLNRNRHVKTSWALWLVVLWVAMGGTRAPSEWLAAFGIGHTGPAVANSYVDGSPVDRNIFLALLIPGVYVLFQRRRRVLTLLRANGPILLYFLYCGISVSWSDYPDVAIRRWFKALGDVVMALLVVTDLNPSVAMRRLIARLGFIFLPLSILFIKWYGNLGRDYRPDYGNWIITYTGVTTSKNMLGMIVLIFGLGAVWRLLQAWRRDGDSRRPGVIIAQGVLLVIAIWLFHLVHSMTSLACFMMAVCLLVVTSLPIFARKPWVVHVLVGSMVTLSFLVLFLNIGTGLLTTMGRDATLTGRTDIWNLVLGMTASPLVGTGFESFWLGKRLDAMWAIYWWHPNEAHNGYLEVYLTLGWIGIFLLAMLLITGYWHGVNEFRRDPETGKLKLAYFVIAVAYNFTESAIRTMNPVWTFFLIATLAVPPPKRIKRKPPPPAPLLEAQNASCLEEV